MERTQYIEHIKLMLTGGVLRCELSDDTLSKILDIALDELQRYIDQSKFITVPFARCIDLSGSNVSSVVAVYRTKGYLSGYDGTQGNVADTDPFQAQLWRVFSNNGQMYLLNDYVLNYASFATLLSMRSAQSTDLAFRVDRSSHKLYVNVSEDMPASITIEFIPKFQDVNEIEDAYWIDILKRLAVAHAKVIVGTVRTKYTNGSTNTWGINGELMLTMGNEELAQLRETLRTNSMLFYPVD